MSAKNVRMTAKDVLSSAFFQKTLARARKLAQNPPKVLSLASLAVARLAEEEGRSSLHTLKENLLLLIRLIRAALKGDYRQLPYTSLVKIILAVLYFVSFVDVIPDYIPVLGYLDDAMVIGWVMDSIKKDIIAFRDWEVNGAPARM